MPKRVQLTEREIDVLRLLSRGGSTESIGDDLGIGVETVRTHIKSAMAKLGTRDRAHAVAEAMRLKLFH